MCEFSGKKFPKYNNTGTCEDCLSRNCYLSRHNVTGSKPADLLAKELAEDSAMAAKFNVSVDDYRRWMQDACA